MWLQSQALEKGGNGEALPSLGLSVTFCPPPPLDKRPQLLSCPAGAPLLRLFLVCSLGGLVVMVVSLLTSSGRPLSRAVAEARLHLHAPRSIDVSQPTDLHGRVHKAGPINLQLFHPQHRQSCYQDQLRWTDAAAMPDNLTQAELNSLQHVPCPHCQVFVVRPDSRQLVNVCLAACMCVALAPCCCLRALCLLLVPA